jgi:SAM-dependent methyltransferase
MTLGRTCPICRARFLRFARTSPGSRDRGVCPRCRSRQRHRLLWLYLERCTELTTTANARVLQFAPDASIERRLRAIPALRYSSADIEPGRGDLTLDLEALDLPDASFDVVLCVHVLEHVEDDRRALRELHRILAPGGWGVVQVPIQGEHTQEASSVRTPEERRRRFGQEDHVRIYGRDFRERLAEADFDVNVVLYRDQIPPDERVHFGLGYDLRREFGVDFDALDEPWEIWTVRR